METKTELLPCPSCGGKADFFDDKMTGYVFCTCCELRTGGTYSWRYKDWKETEANAWNARVYPAEVQAAIERDTAKKANNIVDEGNLTFWSCPACGSLGVGPEVVCAKCGQRLDWSE